MTTSFVILIPPVLTEMWGGVLKQLSNYTERRQGPKFFLEVGKCISHGENQASWLKRKQTLQPTGSWNHSNIDEKSIYSLRPISQCLPGVYMVAAIPVDFHLGAHVNRLQYAPCLRETHAAAISHLDLRHGAYLFTHEVNRWDQSDSASSLPLIMSVCTQR